MDSKDPKLPAQIGRYQIRSLIGRGGMGEVYGAFDPSLDRLVALKTIIAGSDNPSLVERLQREARACGRLHHPGIVMVHDLGEAHGTVFIAMEWLQGESLAEAMSTGRLSFETKLRVLVEILDALSYAHGEGVIHRDIKPSNAWMLPSGHVKLLDFGLARLQNVEALTLQGEVMGTPYYMSPEQLMGHPVDARSDVFSTGVLAYELFAERRAFEAESITAIIVKVLQETPPPIGASWTGAFPEVEAIISKSIAKLPDDRYASAQDMSDALRQFIEAHRDEIRQVDAGFVHPYRAAAPGSSGDTATALAPHAVPETRAADLPTYVLGASTPPPRPPVQRPHAGPAIVAMPVPDARSAGPAPPVRPAPPAVVSSGASSGAADTTVRLESRDRLDDGYVPPAAASGSRKMAAWVLPAAAVLVLVAGVGAYVTFSGHGTGSTSGTLPETVTSTPSAPAPVAVTTATPASTPEPSGVSTPAVVSPPSQTTPTPAPTVSAALPPQGPLPGPDQGRAGPPGGRRGVPVAALKGFSVSDQSTQGLRGTIAARLEERGVLHQLRPVDARYLIRATSEISTRPGPGPAGTSALTADYSGEIQVLDRGTGRTVTEQFDGHVMEFGPAVVRQKAMKELVDKMMEYLATVIRP